MIKKLFLIACFGAFFCAYTMAQDVDQRLLVKYSEAELVDMKKKNNAEYEFQLYCLDNAFSKVTYSSEKGGNYPELTLPTATSTYLDLGLSILKDKNQAYKLAGTNELLVLNSEIVLRLKYKNSKK
jgi:hypothetical protein